METLPQRKDANTRDQLLTLRFQRLKVIENDFDEIWFSVLVNVDKLANRNNGNQKLRVLQIAEHLLSRYLRVLPMRTKSSQQTVKTPKRMFKNP